MAFKPLADQLLVRADPVPDEYVTSEGAHLAVSKDENLKHPIGTVVDKGVSIGDDFKPGTRIFMRKYCADDIYLYDKEGRLIPDMVVIKMEDVIGFDDGKEGLNLQKEKDA